MLTLECILIKRGTDVLNDEWMNSIDFVGHWEKVNVIDKCIVSGDFTLRVI